MNQTIKYIFVWPGIIKVFVNEELVYQGNDWKTAQLYTVPF